jgi:hypothetical protein
MVPGGGSVWGTLFNKNTGGLSGGLPGAIGSGNVPLGLSAGTPTDPLDALESNISGGGISKEEAVRLYEEALLRAGQQVPIA